MSDLPSHARVVVIGGGAVGCSVLYHLAERGWSDLVLLEKNELTAGSSWHAAGNCPNFSGNWGVMRMQRYSTQLYKTLGEKVGYPMNYSVTGSVRLAHTQARFDEFRHVAALGRHCGAPFEIVTPTELKEFYPFMETHDLIGGLWDPDDGDIDPAQLTQGFATGARNMGAKIIRFCPVTALEQRADKSWRVTTPQGQILADIVVNAAGYYAPRIGRMIGRELPSVVMEHQYMITAEIPALAGLEKKLPLLRDPDDSYYLRQERHGLLLGPYEHRNARARWTHGDIPDDFSFQLFPDDLERLESYIEKACARVPLLGEAGISKVINGPIPYAPDGNPLIGPTPGRVNAFEACVFTFGIVQSGGAGKLCAEWIVEGEPEWDVWSLDPRRFTDYAAKSYCLAKAVEVYESEYAIGFPLEERPAGRPAKVSPLYDRLKARGAVFGARGGWERAVWFARTGDDVAAQPTYRELPFLDAVREECLAVRDACGLLDLTGFSRFELTGAGAAQWLNGMIAGRLPKVGRTTLAYFCSPKGSVVTEMTVTRFGENNFWLITAAAAEWHDRDWLQQRLPGDGAARLHNITTRFGALVLAGPRSREILAAVTDAPLDNAAFPWLAARDIEIGPARLKALRVNYVGELGWELHVPMENMLAVHDLIARAGEPHGLRPFGMYAMDSMRLEKGYRGWKSELTSELTPFEIGLERFVAMDKGDFLGRAALAAHVPKNGFAILQVEPGPADAPYGAPVWADGALVGYVTSAGFGHRTGLSLALASVRRDLALTGRAVELEILGERRKAVVMADAPYDAKNERLKG